MIKFLKFIPVQLTFFIIVGILIGDKIHFSNLFIFQGLLSLTFIFGLIYFLTIKKNNGNGLFISLFFVTTIFIGIATITLQNSRNSTNYFGNKIAIKKLENSLIYFRITKILKANSFYEKYEAEVTRVDSTKVLGKVLVNIHKDSTKTTIKIDDLLLTKTIFNAISEPKNPYTFNYKKYLKNKQIYYQIFINKNQYKKLLKHDITLKGLAYSIRQKIILSLQKKGFKNDVLAVINALLLGQRNSVSSELLKSYAGAGAIHILAVSGLHIGILLVVLTWLFKPLNFIKNGKIYGLIIIVVLLWLYAILAGLSASVVRAVSMFTALAISFQVKRLSNLYNVLVISMFFLLLFHPFYLFDVGFQLSYLAVFAIVWLQPKIYNLFSSSVWIQDKLWQLFTVSLAAQIGILPLSIYYFHQFPGLFFIANLIIIPFLGIILTLGIVVIILAVLNVLPEFVANAYRFIIDLMNEIVSFIANQHQFLIQNIYLSFSLMLCFYLFIALFFKFLKKKSFNRLVLVLLSVIVMQVLIIYKKYNLESTNELIVFQKTKSSIIGVRKGDNLKVYLSNKNVKNKFNALNNYIVKSGVTNISYIKKHNRIIPFAKNNFLCIDKLGLYPSKLKEPVVVILQNSPKINLERLLKSLKPTLIIADGSNFKSYSDLWSKTCYKNKTPFYNTMQKGAFKILN